MPPELIGPTPPKAHPDVLFTGIAADISTTATQDLRAFMPYPASHSVTCFLQLFLRVVIAGPQSRLASPSSIEELYLTTRPLLAICLTMDAHSVA